MTLRRPPAGVRFALQRGKADATGHAELVDGQVADGVSDLRFEWTVRVAQTGSAPPRFLGAFKQRSPAARFVYITVGVTVVSVGLVILFKCDRRRWERG